MKARYSVLNALLFAGLICMLIAPIARGEVFEKTKNVGATAVHYKVVLPDGYDPAKAYPAVFAFPPSSQSMEIVNESWPTITRSKRKSAATYL